MLLSIELLEETPFWVYVVFVILLLLGLRATRSKTVPFKQVFFLPALFVFWAIYTIEFLFKGHYCFLPLWLVALYLGSVLGYLQVRHWEIHVNRERGTITLPGSWIPLLLSLCIFSLRYFFSFAYSSHPDAMQNPLLYLTDLGSSGIITGILLGRFWRFRIVYHHH